MGYLGFQHSSHQGKKESSIKSIPIRIFRTSPLFFIIIKACIHISHKLQLLNARPSHGIQVIQSGFDPEQRNTIIGSHNNNKPSLRKYLEFENSTYIQPTYSAWLKPMTLSTIELYGKSSLQAPPPPPHMR